MKLRSFCGDAARETVEEEEKVNHGDSYAYWLCNNSFDLNESQREEDKEQGSHENTNGAFSSSSSSRRIDFDLNEPPPSDSEREEPQQSPDRCSLTLLGNHDIPENPPNPNPQSSPSSGKRRSTTGGFKKAKKPRPHEPPEAVSEVVSPPKWLDQVMKTMEETKAPHRISKAPLTCEDARLIFEKELSVSDVNPKQSRYLMPFNQLKRNDFLTQLESSFIEQEEDEEGDKPGVGVVLVNQKAEKWFLLLKRWKMTKKKNSENGTLNYALSCGWNDVVKGNGLKAKDKISLWSFRFEEVLYFALGTV